MDGGRQSPERGREVEVFAIDRQSGAGNLGAKTPDAHQFQEIVGLDAVLPRELDEGILVGRLAERPGRVPGQPRIVARQRIGFFRIAVGAQTAPLEKFRTLNCSVLKPQAVRHAL